MPKGRRSQVGGFAVGEKVWVDGAQGEIQSFPTRRVAVVRVKGVTMNVSTRDLRRVSDGGNSSG